MDEFRWERGVRVQSASGQGGRPETDMVPGLSLCHACRKLGSCFLFEGRTHLSGEGLQGSASQRLPYVLLTLPDCISSTERETKILRTKVEYLALGETEKVTKPGSDSGLFT